MHTCTTYRQCLCREWGAEPSDPLELEVQMVGRGHVDVENEPRSSVRVTNAPNH